MKILLNNNDLNEALSKVRNLGFVPTMGSLHKGHISLIKRSKKECEKTIVSIFVNPKQFNNKNDFKKYPRNQKKDLIILKKLNVNFVFIPKINQIFHTKKITNIKIEKKNQILFHKVSCKSNKAFENINGVPTLVTGSATSPPDVKALQVGWGFSDDGLVPEVRDGVTTSPGLACEADLSVMLGEEVLFVEEGSTSGYLYPSLQLKKAGIDYTSDITQRFAGSHDGVIAGLYNGDAKFGVTYDDARRTLRKTNPDVGEKVIAFAITEEIPNDVIAVRTDLPEDIKQKIYDILSEFIATEDGRALMDEIYGWTDLVPADNSEFDVVREAAQEFGLYDD